MHRDLHINNIMFKGDINDLDNLKWYIIDFGFSFIDVKQTIDIYGKRSASSKYIITDERFKGFDLNPSQDLRMLFLYLLEYCRLRFNRELNGWIVDHLINVSTYLPSRRSSFFHNAYEEVYSIIDNNLTPSYILNNEKPIQNTKSKNPFKKLFSKERKKPVNIRLDFFLNELKNRSNKENPFKSIYLSMKDKINKVLKQE